MKSIILTSLILLATLSHADNIGSEKDMALSISDKRHSISGDKFDDIVGFEIMFGRTSDFGKIYISYDEGSSQLFERQSYFIGADAYLIKNRLLNLSAGINVGSGKLLEKKTDVDIKLMIYSISTQIDAKFGESIHGFAKMSYQKSFQLEECYEGNHCFNSQKLKDLNDFKSRAISIGLTWNF